MAFLRYISNIVIFMQRIDQQAIQRELMALNISYDMNIVKQVDFFLNKFIGPLSPQEAHYHIPAASAIIGQTLKIQTVDHSGYTTTGTKIENVMRHIGSLSKEKFLDTIKIQIDKSNYCSHSLIEKVQKIKIAFRVFKKFKSIFESLGVQNGITFAVSHELLALFWIIFLTAKCSLNALEDLNYSTKILALIIQEVFCNYYASELKSKIRQYITRNDNFPELGIISPEEDILIKRQIRMIFSSALGSRDPSATPNHNKLLKNSILLSRLVDDLNSQYQKIYLELPENRFVDEMTFLELSKNLTPQAFAFKSNKQPINKVLSFGDDDEDLDQSPKTEEKKPLFAEQENSELLPFGTSTPTMKDIKPAERTERKSKPIHEFTPVSLGQSKASWARDVISSFESKYEANVKAHIQSKGHNYLNFCNAGKFKIEVQIKELTQYISNIEKGVSETLTMTLCLAGDILSRNPNIDITQDSYFSSLLSVAAYLFNCTTRYLSLELQKYCQKYKADLISCLLVIYQVSQNQNLPLFVKEMLEKLEKQVLIRELWSCDQGYKYLSEGSLYHQNIIRNRLDRIIYERIKEICEASKVDQKDAGKIEALVKEIMQKKKEMLRMNTLDQIMICSILACLNLNEAKYNLALSNIFCSYSSISLSLQTNREVPSMEQDVATKTLLEYYNQTFIREVQDMMSQDQQPKYLCTPIRKTHIENMRPPPAFDYGMGPMGRGSGIRNYQQQIIYKMKQQNADEEMDDKNQSSPTFGYGLSRKFTFGPQDS